MQGDGMEGNKMTKKEKLKTLKDLLWLIEVKHD